MWVGPARSFHHVVSHCRLISTKHIIGWLSVQAREIRDGYLMKRSDFNASLQHVWEDKNGWRRHDGEKNASALSRYLES